MVAKYYGRSFELSTLREFCYLNKSGAPLLGVNDAAERIGFRCMGIKSGFEKFATKSIFPCIVHWRSDHYVVVYRVKVRKRGEQWTGKVYVADPAFGKVTYTAAEFLDGWISGKEEGEDTGIFLMLVPTLEFFHPNAHAEKSVRTKLFYFFSYITPYKKFWMQIILGMVMGMVFSLIFPFLSQAVVDKGIMNSNLNFIYLVMAAQLILSVSGFCMGFIRSWILLHVTSRISIALISDFIAKMLNLPITFFGAKSRGDIMQRIGDHSRIRTFLTGTTLGVAFSFVNFFIFAGILAYYNLQMLLIFIVGHTLYVGWVMLFLKIRRELDYKTFEKSARNQSNLIEIITGAEEVKLCGAEQKMRNKWEFIQADMFLLGVKGLRISQIQSTGAFFFSNITNITLSALSAYLVVNGDITLGMMMSLSYILGQLKGPVGSFIGFVHAFQDAKISIERLGEVHFQKDENQDNEFKVAELPPRDRDIYIKNLTFSYMGEKVPPVLKNVTITIPHNKITAIVGESGSGKTTLVKLLLGYYEPLEGEIFIGNTNLKNLNTKYWRSQCAAVMQDGFVFSAGVAENIAISDSVIDRDKLYEASLIANFHDFAEQMPMGYNTKIGEAGSGISQGQRQRLLIARSVYKNPSFIFLDEATNALDANNERTVIENLNRFLSGRTAVIVAHRLSTVKHADQIVVLDKGMVAEMGAHRELLAQKGVYYNLVKNQLEL
jgi:ATP-binding cassette subfamily B protein